jgi:hypothetical protein
MASLSNSLPSEQSRPSPLGAVLSALLPGLGLLVRGLPTHMVWVVVTGGILLGITWGLGLVGGLSAQIFFAILIILPWWCNQAYEAYLPHPSGQLRAFHTAWKLAHDIRYLGGLFLFTAITDLYIILVNPEYQLAIFCEKPSGIPGFFAKAQSPVLHVAIGHGFIKLRRWSFFVYLVYAGFGLLNAMTNFSCFGFGRIRTVFFISLLAFTAYVIWRRDCFLVSH